MTEKRVVKAKQAWLGGNQRDGWSYHEIKVLDCGQLPDEFEIVYDEPDEPAPHQCKGLLNQGLRISACGDGEAWAMEKREFEDGADWTFHLWVSHGCPCCDWTVPAERPKPEPEPEPESEPEPERGPEWIPLRDVKHLGWFETENGARYLRVGEEDADGLIRVGRDIGSYVFMPSDAFVKPVDPFAKKEATDD